MDTPTVIKSEKDMTGALAKTLRKSLGLSQPAFWLPVGVSQPSASRYERERDTIAAEPVRILLFARYVAGVDIDASTPEGIDRLKRLGRLQKQSEKLIWKTRKKTAAPETEPS